MPEEKGHCEDHRHRDELIEANTNSNVATQSSLSTLKWVFGILMTIGIFILGTGVTLTAAQMSGIASELKSINAAVHSIALDQVAVKSDIDNIKWRLEQLETSKVARRSK